MTDPSAPPVDLAEIERLLDVFGQKSANASEGGSARRDREANEALSALLTAIRQLASPPVAVPADVAKAADELWGRLADLQGEHEVMAGPFDPSQWTLDGIRASHIKVVVEYLCPGAKQALNGPLRGRPALHADKPTVASTEGGGHG